MKYSREPWKNTICFLLSAIGAAVGLGNIWKFPYVIGTNGGGCFLLVYIVCSSFCALPILLAELAIGRYSKKNTIDAFKELSIKFSLSKYWNYIPILGLITALLILSFYTVVSGWSLYYLILSLSGSLSNVTTVESLQIWVNFSGSIKYIILFNTIFIVITFWCISKGINNGLERLNIVSVPMLFILLLILIFYVAIESPSSFIRAIKFIFLFNYNNLVVKDMLLSL